MISQLTRVLSEEECDLWEAGLLKGSIPINLLEKIVQKQLSELIRPSSSLELSTKAWSLERAHRDGGAYYLQKLLTLCGVNDG